MQFPSAHLGPQFFPPAKALSMANACSWFITEDETEPACADAAAFAADPAPPAMVPRSEETVGEQQSRRCKASGESVLLPHHGGTDLRRVSIKSS